MKLTKPQQDALIRVREYPVISEGGGYHLSNGESIHSGVVQRLIDKGALIPSGDGLMEGFTQTYVVSP